MAVIRQGRIRAADGSDREIHRDRAAKGRPAGGRLAGMGVLAGVLLIAAAGVASATVRDGTHRTHGTPGETASGRIAHPEQDVAGAGIKRAEGTDGPAADSTRPAPAGPSAGRAQAAGRVLGMDVSSHQGEVDWSAAAAGGATFAYVKATEGTGYTNPYFDEQYGGAADAGMYRGAYHFALPDQSSGAAQAGYFLDSSGAGFGDLPPALDIEYNPYGETCYGLRPADMVRWIHDFTGAVAHRIGRQPVIYTSTKWWTRCTGGDPGFGRSNPLWLPHYGSSVGSLPAGWTYQTFWQFANSGPFPGDQDEFNGSADRLGRLSTR